ncbi:hypothetical protein [Corynebacterium vitaeruminis]|uniref:hypothetical protein n=1 Tax=Corynebacterium vitaeruminis TaxID=38305 RepID=UPI0023F0ABB3|nr:hypothetical protein [Corynebacterium vitaeruminis]
MHDVLISILGKEDSSQDNQSIVREFDESYNSKGEETPNEQPLHEPLRNPVWVMPRFRERDICDWVDSIKKMKRESRLQDALEVAKGCLDAMIEVAQENPSNAMPFYVEQVAIIQHKMKDYQAEVETLERWFALNIGMARYDEFGLKKRLVKAKEQLAKLRGEDFAKHTVAWRKFIQLEKEAKEQSAAEARVREEQFRQEHNCQ